MRTCPLTTGRGSLRDLEGPGGTNKGHVRPCRSLSVHSLPCFWQLQDPFWPETGIQSLAPWPQPASPATPAPNRPCPSARACVSPCQGCPLPSLPSTLGTSPPPPPQAPAQSLRPAPCLPRPSPSISLLARTPGHGRSPQAREPLTQVPLAVARGNC